MAGTLSKMERRGEGAGSGARRAGVTGMAMDTDGSGTSAGHGHGLYQPGAHAGETGQRCVHCSPSPHPSFFPPSLFLPCSSCARWTRLLHLHRPLSPCFSFSVPFRTEQRSQPPFFPFPSSLTDRRPSLSTPSTSLSFRHTNTSQWETSSGTSTPATSPSLRPAVRIAAGPTTAALAFLSSVC